MAINIPKNASDAQKLAMRKLNEILDAIDNELNLLATETAHAEWEYKATQAQRRISLTHTQAIVNGDFDITKPFEQETDLTLQNQAKRIKRLNEEHQNRKQASQHFSSPKNLNSIKFLLDIRPTEPSDNIPAILKTFAAKKGTLPSQQDVASNIQNFVAGKINLTEYAANQNKASRLITQERERIAAQPQKSQPWSLGGMIGGLFTRLVNWVSSLFFEKATSSSTAAEAAAAPVQNSVNNQKSADNSSGINASAVNNSTDKNNEIQRKLMTSKYDNTVGPEHAKQDTQSTHDKDTEVSATHEGGNQSIHAESPLEKSNRLDG